MPEKTTRREAHAWPDAEQNRRKQWTGRSEFGEIINSRQAPHGKLPPAVGREDTAELGKLLLKRNPSRTNVRKEYRQLLFQYLGR